MRSPTAALLWEIWRRHQWTVAAIAGLTAAGRVVDALERRTGGADSEASALATLLAMVAFLLLLSVFNYTESPRGKGVGRFPQRLFTLPVTSLRLVTVPMLAGIASIELLYLLWMGPLSTGGSASAPFVSVLFAAFVVCYLSALWTLERAGSLRLLVLGMIAFALFAVGVLPSFPPTPPPFWRSEIVLTAVVAGGAVFAFLLAWHHVARLRSGGTRRAEWLWGPISIAAPTRRRAFANPAAAQFWFEWRSSGIVLPALVGGVVVLVIMPTSWMVQSDAAYTFYLLLVAVASPIVMAVPVGIAFGKPAFWSEDLAVPAFVAVRPLSSEDLVAIKVKVAAVSAALSWMIVLACLATWLSSWGNLDFVSQFAISLWAFHGQSVWAVCGIVALLAIAAMLLTWRFLVSRFWSGLSGMRPLFAGSVVWLVVLVIAGIAFDAGRLPGWLLGDPGRLGPVVAIGAVLVIAKYWIAAYAWRSVAPRYLRPYLVFWLAATTSFLTLGMVLWGLLRIYLPLDVERSRSLVILLALIAVPLARVGLAPGSLARNRHR